MELSTPYSLPFEVLYQDGPIMSVGQDVSVKVAIRGVVTPEAVDAIDSLITPFFLLATSGAMAGATIRPWLSTIADKQGPFANSDTVEWILQSCTVDRKSIIVLAQMLLSAQDLHPLSRITISGAAGSFSLQRLIAGSRAADPYPTTYRDLDFPVIREQEIGSEVLVRALLQGRVSPEIRTAAEAELLSWAAGLLSGAYGVAPIRPDECTASIDIETQYVDSELTWPITRFMAHPAALDGLTNVFASISHRVVPVRQLAIE
jgi:hypothetical protein